MMGARLMESLKRHPAFLLSVREELRGLDVYGGWEQSNEYFWVRSHLGGGVPLVGWCLQSPLHNGGQDIRVCHSFAESSFFAEIPRGLVFPVGGAHMTRAGAAMGGHADPEPSGMGVGVGVAFFYTMSTTPDANGTAGTSLDTGSLGTTISTSASHFLFHAVSRPRP